MSQDAAEPDPPPRRLDWQAILALAWAVAFGLLYARMVIRERIPALAAWLP